MDSGIILVDKPQGWTSHDVVAVVRRQLPRGTRVGHSGTLDPLASGLLVLLVGRATKSAAVFLGLPKAYSGKIRLGLVTDTGDLAGKVLRERPVPALTAAELQALFDRYHGEVEMPIPAYSAVKYKGKPLYAYARKGIEVPVKTRRSDIMEWTLTGWVPPDAGFMLRCSSGTYARALAMLAGEALGCGGTLSELRREAVGGYELSSALTLEEVRRRGPIDCLLPAALPA